jgi:peptide-methionine (S)-S-oxide reductase
MATAIFGAGCFWGIEGVFRETPGVTDVVVGYSGGVLDNPSYEDVCTGTTGHAEVVKVDFNESKISYDNLLDVFWECHDPTQLNFQGADIGTQYRSVIFTLDGEQEIAARRAKKSEQDSGRYRHAIVTEISSVKIFWPAEDYHQQYITKHRGRFGRLFG